MSLALVLLLGVAIGWLHLSSDPWLEGVDQGAALDWRFRLRGPAEPPVDIAIIVVDDRSLAQIGQWPWPRAKLAEIVDVLRLAGAKSIGFDILLSEHEIDTDGAGDRVLADALQRQGHAVIATALLFNDGSPSAGKVEEVGQIAIGNIVNQQMGPGHVITADEILRPLPAFENVAAVGHVNQQSSEIGQTRTQYPAIAYAGALIPSFPLLLAARQQDLPLSAIGFDYAGRLIFGTQKLPLDDRYGMGLNYLGPTGTFRTYSAMDLLERRIPPPLLKDRAVLVGVSATSLGDNFTTPYSLDLPGVEVLATATDNLMRGSGLIRTPEQRVLEAIAIIALALSSWRLGIRAQRLVWGLFNNLALLIAWLVFAQLMFSHANRLVAMSGPMAAIIAGGALGLLARLVLERRLRNEAERHRGNLARYVPPSLAETLAERATPAFDAREQLAAVMFVDLQGFTHASEERSPADTAQFLKSFHAQIEDVVAAHGGIVAQFLGDGALMLWGLPQPREDDPVRALACARDMLLRLRRWHPENPARAGLHFGPVAMAQLGGRHQAQLAAAGDTVNVASRLEAAAKATGTVLVISDDMVSAIRALGREDLISGLVARPEQPVRGRDKPISYWSAASCADLA
ncbi:CHASE2 domain-containing protein [Dongia rigui]|uniref:Adenylate/guanylate cyclase domain-containing protein n=1 Tax=Dongia rigui TaxID=940149 RepID=A0ABU5DVL1_9PROT|nr:adenylate/guanylate cyclase domain-containing protein [Dongia rigui]MDY0870738.1 adenylate/guanylate cyclase domain-containing protein [Dongia rigui]